jgi:hypothetical protein
LRRFFPHSRQQDPFNFKNTNILKFKSDSLHLLEVKIKPAVLNNLSQAAEEGRPLLYFLMKI